MAIINTALLQHKESQRDDMIIEIGLHQREPEPCRDDMIITTKFAEKARRTRRDSGGVNVFRFLIGKMLKQVQHDGRVGITRCTDSVINGRHPELVSGSVLFLT